MAKKGLLLGGAVVAAILVGLKVASTKKSLEMLQYTLQGIKASFKNPLNPILTFTLRIFNPNQVPVPVQNVAGSITLLSGSTIGTFFNQDPIDISGRETANVPISVRINAFQAILSIINKDSFAVIKIDGVIKTAGVQVPITNKITLTK